MCGKIRQLLYVSNFYDGKKVLNHSTLMYNVWSKLRGCIPEVVVVLVAGRLADMEDMIEDTWGEAEDRQLEPAWAAAATAADSCEAVEYWAAAADSWEAVEYWTAAEDSWEVG